VPPIGGDDPPASDGSVPGRDGSVGRDGGGVSGGMLETGCGCRVTAPSRGRHASLWLGVLALFALCWRLNRR
jgi:MYXO-CTERM domain-containing protein